MKRCIRLPRMWCIIKFWVPFVLRHGSMIFETRMNYVELSWTRYARRPCVLLCGKCGIGTSVPWFQSSVLMDKEALPLIASFRDTVEVSWDAYVGCMPRSWLDAASLLRPYLCSAVQLFVSPKNAGFPRRLCIVSEQGLLPKRSSWGRL